MIRWLFKYSVFLYLINTILLTIKYTFGMGNIIFLGIMGLYTILIFVNPQQFKSVLLHKGFLFLLILTVLNILYLVIFDSISNLESLKFLSARAIQFSIIPLAIYHHLEYYKDKFLNHLVYIIFGIVLLGLLLNPYIFSGRYSGIIWNPNALSSFTTIAFGIVLLKNEKKSNFDYVLLFTFLIISLATGSRGALVGIALAYVLRYGFSTRNVIYAIISVILYLFVLNLNFDTSLNRLGTQSLLSDRTLQYQYAIETFFQKPISGWGLDKYAFINTRLLPSHYIDQIVGAHNGYLAILVQYGMLFSIFIFYIIFSKSFTVIKYFNKDKIGYTAIYSFLIIYTLLASIYESLMTGINEFHTMLFWFSLAILSFSKFKHEN